MKSSTSKVLQLLLRFLVVVGMARFLIATTAAAGNTKHHELGRNMGREKHLSKFDLNYVSKRRIPNGPDPIHNRRTGSSRQPPGQA
ncbi:hypothetical protein C2S52_020605 [Perilla frutescens var. hirtella]|nr:hypothetical protein C2S52_020605 [Perilla frutescens var. hirtella]KAH6805260.1 hypothetical protein C2S51_030091 [Perilla frutescens var. frutescens]